MQGIIPGSVAESKGIMAVAEKMIIAARTAPKARGVDHLVSAILTPGPTLDEIRKKMVEYGEESGMAAFPRDSKNLEDVEAIVLLGSRKATMGLKICSFCGFASCEDLQAHGGTCAYNSGDLGIAVGSAVSIAADHRVDNRIMYTIGVVAVRLGILGDDVQIAFGIPLAVKGKNIFFDRK